MLIVALAATAMVIQDVLAVFLTQSEARNRAGLAALFDSLMWVAGILTTTVSVTVLQGHSLSEKAVVIAAVTGANALGSFGGVKLGARFIRAEGEAGTPE